jgi:Asp-tRNA(Asn)/Glu-tRNA(Gln) amidotransferase A subunit family amidase
LINMTAATMAAPGGKHAGSNPVNTAERAPLMTPEQFAEKISAIKQADIKVHAWRAFSDQNAWKRPPDGEFDGLTGPLAGLTIGVKDIIDVEGLPTRHGSPIYENAAPALTDAACVSLMRAAGAIIVGKTVTTELATFVPSVTRNPHILEHTPGGSSAGSAAAVAAGHVDIAIGTQTAGSIIRPAAYCGVFGFKPTFGLVPRTGVKLQCESLDTIGVFARSVAHCQSWLAAMLAQPENDVSQPQSATASTPRLVVLRKLPYAASEEMLPVLEAAVHSLRAAGIAVTDGVLPPAVADVHLAQQIVQGYESARAYHAERVLSRGSGAAKMSAALAAVLEQAAAIRLDEYLAALNQIAIAQRVADECLQGSVFWLLPSSGSRAPRDLTSTGDPIWNRLASALHTPCINIPVTSHGEILPLGLQLIGARGLDWALLDFAALIKRAVQSTDEPQHRA